MYACVCVCMCVCVHAYVCVHRCACVHVNFAYKTYNRLIVLETLMLWSTCVSQHSAYNQWTLIKDCRAIFCYSVTVLLSWCYFLGCCVIFVTSWQSEWNQYIYMYMDNICMYIHTVCIYVRMFSRTSIIQTPVCHFNV